MFVRSAIATTLFFFASSAVAQDVNAGAAALARSIGVQPGLYTVPELIEMRQAREDGKIGQMRFFQSGDNEVRPSTREAPNPAIARMARSAGISPYGVTSGQVLQLLDAQAAANTGAIHVARDAIEGNYPHPREHVSPGERTLAAELGVDAADYTLSELVRMKFKLDE